MKKTIITHIFRSEITTLQHLARAVRQIFFGFTLDETLVNQSKAYQASPKRRALNELERQIFEAKRRKTPIELLPQHLREWVGYDRTTLYFHLRREYLRFDLHFDVARLERTAGQGQCYTADVVDEAGTLTGTETYTESNAYPISPMPDPKKAGSKLGTLTPPLLPVMLEIVTEPI